MAWHKIETAPKDRAIILCCPGGQTMTTFQVFAFAHPSREKAIKCCAGVWKPWDRILCSRW